MRAGKVRRYRVVFEQYDTVVAREKRDLIKRLMDELDIDVWLIFSQEGSDPCLPLVVGGQTVGATAYFVCRDGRRVAVVANYDVGHVELFGTVDEIVPYKLGISEPLRKVYRSLKPQRMALNYSSQDVLSDGLTHGQYLFLEEVLGKEELQRVAVSSEPLLARVRGIKSPTEIERITRAVELCQQVYDSVFQQVRPGMSEIEAQALFIAEQKKMGIEEPHGPIVCISRVGLAHRGPTEAVIEPGDSVIFDFGVKYRGYTSDIARTVYFLRPGESSAPEEVTHAITTVVDAITAAFRALRPGVCGWEVDQAARDVLVSRGYPEITHACGHQVGRHGHDGGTLLGPRWERYGRAPYGKVEAGMVFTLEPTIIISGGQNVIIEEDALVTEDGARMLSRRQEEVICLR